MNKERVKELLLEALETELGGVEIYKAALRCARNAELHEEWEKYLEQTRNHVVVVRGLCEEFGADAAKDTPGRKIVRRLGESLVDAIRMAEGAGDEKAAQLVATECVVLAETKDHHNWELLGEVAKQMKGDGASLRKACEEVEEEEDEHLFHSQGWSRELWIQSLGMKAVLPPPEERKDVKTAIGAARAKQARTEMT